MTDSVGIDRASKRWILVRLRDGRFADATVADSLTPAPQICDRAETVAIDIPLSFPTGATRQSEVAGRHILGRRSSTMFATPPRSVLEEPTYQDALTRSRSEYNKGISAQAYALRTGIFDAISAPLPLVETHPELSFLAMTDEDSLAPKKTWTGMRQRIRLLQDQGIVIPEALGLAGLIATDDLLDAAAAAWTAHRISTGEAVALGFSEHGQIWF